jgi:hypothetical protein
MSEQGQDQSSEYEQRLKALSAPELLFQCAGSLLNLAAIRLGLGGEPGGKDLSQARQAIDGVRALLPVLEGACPQQQVEAIRGSVTQLQLLFAKVAGGGGKGQPGPAERSGRLWVPGGA